LSVGPSVSAPLCRALGLQEGDDVLAEASVDEGAPVRAVLVEREARVRDSLRRLPVELGRVEALVLGGSQEA
jgi:hypothetical protein